MTHPLHNAIGVFQRELQTKANEVEGRAQPGPAGEYLRGVAHGYRKAAEDLGRFVLQGRLPGEHTWSDCPHAGGCSR